MASLLDLANRMQKLKEDIDKRRNALVNGFSEYLLKTLVYETPVDTSNALSNWRLQLNIAPTDSEIPPYFSGEFGSTAGESRDAAVKAGLSELKSRNLGDTVYISNTVAYMVKLNQGTSIQAPPLFFESCVLRVRKYIERELR